MKKATITQKAKKLIIRVKNQVVGVIAEPCADTNYRYQVKASGRTRTARSLPGAVIAFDDMTNYAYSFLD